MMSLYEVGDRVRVDAFEHNGKVCKEAFTGAIVRVVDLGRFEIREDGTSKVWHRTFLEIDHYVEPVFEEAA